MKGKTSEQHFSLNWFVIRKCLIYFEKIHTKNYEANSGVGAAWYRMFNNSTFLSKCKRHRVSFFACYFWRPMIHCRAHRNSPVDNIVNHMNLGHSLPAIFALCFLMLSSHLHLGTGDCFSGSKRPWRGADNSVPCSSHSLVRLRGVVLN
jgi:hypothetical protein